MAPCTEFARYFYAGIGPLLLGVVLVFILFVLAQSEIKDSIVSSIWRFTHVIVYFSSMSCLNLYFFHYTSKTGASSIRCLRNRNRHDN